MSATKLARFELPNRLVKHEDTATEVNWLSSGGKQRIHADPAELSWTSSQGHHASLVIQ